MREIKFRGKRVDNGEWGYGYYFILPAGAPAILNYYMGYEQVIPETVGQFTGLTDKNGTEIFEGDILLKGFEKVLVKWNSNQCRWGIYSDGYEVCGFNESTGGYFDVISNIYDNPELLEDMK